MNRKETIIFCGTILEIYALQKHWDRNPILLLLQYLEGFIINLETYKILLLSAF